MLIAQAVKKAYHFNLDDQDDVEGYQALLQNPAVTILEKKFVTHTETHHEADYNTSKTEQHVYLEVEECIF